MKRNSNESVEDYKERRRQSKILEKAALIGRMIWSGGTYRRFPKPEPEERPVLISPAVGKRHKGESLKNFRKRRQVCNHKRRIREKQARWCHNEG